MQCRLPQEMRSKSKYFQFQRLWINFFFSWFSSQYFQVFLPLRLLIVWLWVLLVLVQAPGDFDLFVTGQAKMGEKLFRKMWVYLSKGKDEKEPGAFRGHPGKCGSHSSRGLPLEDWARGGGTSDQCLSDLTLEREYQEKYILYKIFLLPTFTSPMFADQREYRFESRTERILGFPISDTDFRPGLR